MKIRISPQALTRAGLRVIANIRARTLAGNDASGKPFAPYSTKPFVVPLGAILKKALNTLKGEPENGIFTTQSGALWLYIQGGYKALREASGKPTKTNMSFTGSMLRSLTVISTGENTIRIGFTDAESAEKAYFHNISGAGKNHIVRKFLDIADTDLTDGKLVQIIQDGVELE